MSIVHDTFFGIIRSAALFVHLSASIIEADAFLLPLFVHHQATSSIRLICSCFVLTSFSCSDLITKDKSIVLNIEASRVAPRMYDRRQLCLQLPIKAPKRLVGGSRLGLVNANEAGPELISTLLLLPAHITDCLIVSVLYMPLFGENVVNKSEDILDTTLDLNSRTRVMYGNDFWSGQSICHAPQIVQHARREKERARASSSFIVMRNRTSAKHVYNKRKIAAAKLRRIIIIQPTGWRENIHLGNEHNLHAQNRTL